ncbi:MAG: hypothetical protein R3E08_09785 [Thiotrichaceae bacterium]
MTQLKLINIYLDGFRSRHYDKQSVPVCPYAIGTDERMYWLRGFEYAENVEKFLRELAHPKQNTDIC